MHIINLEIFSFFINIKKVQYVATLLVMLLIMADNVTAYDIVTLKSKDVAPYNQALNGFKSVIHSNISEYLISDSSVENRKLIKKIEKSNPSLILTIGLNASLLAKNKISDIPVIYCMVMNPGKHDLIDKKKNTFIGIALNIPIEEQLQQLLKVLPGVKKLGVIYNPENSKRAIADAQQAAKEKGISLIARKVNSKRNVPKAIRAIVTKIDALWLLADATVVTRESFSFLLLSALEQKLPIMAHSERFVQAGALFSVAPSYYDIGRQAAKYAMEIIENNSMDFSLIKPDVVNLTINLKTAKKIDVHIPEHVLNLANKIFK